MHKKLAAWMVAWAGTLGLWSTAARAEDARGAGEAIELVGAKQVSGVVYWDENGNGRRDTGETGVAGVRVSGGLRMVSTGTDGGYTLGSDEPIVAVSVGFPSGTWPTGPWFLRTSHAEEKGMDFGLRKDPQDLPLVFVQMTDLHGNLAWSGKAVPAELAQARITPKFYVVTGDLRSGEPAVSNAAELERSFGAIGRAYATFGQPIFMVPGNHDTVGYGGGGTMRIKLEETKHGLFGERCWERYVCPANWSFDCADVRLVGLGWGEYLDGRWNLFSPTRQGWLEAELAAEPRGKRTILLAHDQSGLVAKFGFTLGLFGHTHTEGRHIGPGQEQPDRGANALYSGVTQPPQDAKAGPRHYTQDGRPTGYRLVVVEQDRMDTFYRAIGEERPVMVNEPRRYQGVAVKGEFIARGQVWDPAGEVTAVVVKLDDRVMENKIERRRYWVDFEAKIAADGMVDGFHDLEVTARTKESRVRLTEPYLLLTGRLEAFAAAGGATIEGTATGLTGPVKVLVNGEAVGEATGERKFTVEVPAKALKRLNVVTVAGTSGKAGLAGLTMKYGGQEYTDQHRAFTWGFQNSVSGSKALYFDLKKPGKAVPWETVTEPAGP